MDIVMVGAGGTGSWLLPPLVKFLGFNGLHNIDIYDNDYVEPKNIVRQNFYEDDIDVNKAEALINRYNVNNITFNKRDMFYSSTRAFTRDHFIDHEKVLVLGCVDTITARKSILNSIIANTEKDVIYIDSGNEQIYGQIHVIIKHNGELLVPKGFMDLLVDDSENNNSDVHISCANMQDQSVSINNKQAAEMIMLLTSIGTVGGILDLDSVKVGDLYNDLKQGIIPHTIYTSYRNTYVSDELISFDLTNILSISSLIYKYTQMKNKGGDS